MGTDQSFVALEEMRRQREIQRKNCFERDCKLVVVVVVVVVATASDVVTAVVPEGLAATFSVSESAPAVVSVSPPTPEIDQPVVVVVVVVVVEWRDLLAVIPMSDLKWSQP